MIQQRPAMRAIPRLPRDPWYHRAAIALGLAKPTWRIHAEAAWALTGSKVDTVRVIRAHTELSLADAIAVCQEISGNRGWPAAPART